MNNRYGKFLTETTTDTTEVVTTTSNEIYTDSVLRAQNFYPIISDEEPPTARLWESRFTLVNDDDGGHIEEKYVVLQEIKSYSKLKILMAAQQSEMLSAFINLLETNTMLKLIWDASNTIEDNELLDQYLPTIGQAIGKTQEEIKEFLDDNCVVDE